MANIISLTDINDLNNLLNNKDFDGIDNFLSVKSQNKCNDVKNF